MKLMSQNSGPRVVARRVNHSDDDAVETLPTVIGIFATASRVFAFMANLAVPVSVLAACADETAIVNSEPSDRVGYQTASLTTDVTAAEDTASAETVANGSFDESTTPLGERVEGELRVISGSEALHAHAARQAEENPAWGALLDEEERPVPESLNLPELTAKMEEYQRTRVVESPTRLSCSDPEIVAAGQRAVPHESDAEIEPAPLVPVERDVTRTLPLRQFAPLSAAHNESLLTALMQTCERLERDPNTSERAAACRVHVSEFSVRLNRGSR